MTMKVQVLFVLVWLLHSFTEAKGERKDVPVTCTTSRAYVSGMATVTCHFSNDVINLLPVSLSVEFYPLKINNSVSVAECFWISEETPCETSNPRHHFSPSAASGDAILEISDVTYDDVGRYVCQQMSSATKNSYSEPCFLSVEEGDSEEWSKNTVWPIALGVGCPAVIVALTVGVVLWRVQCIRQRKRVVDDETPSSTSPEDIEPEKLHSLLQASPQAGPRLLGEQPQEDSPTSRGRSDLDETESDACENFANTDTATS